MSFAKVKFNFHLEPCESLVDNGPEARAKSLKRQRFWAAVRREAWEVREGSPERFEALLGLLGDNGKLPCGKISCTCMKCTQISCPWGEPFHWDADGCPSCFEYEQEEFDALFEGHDTPYLCRE